MRPLIVLLVLLSSPVGASQLWLNTGGMSYHLDRQARFNESNNGLGVEYRWERRRFFSTGTYRNSVSRPSHYVVYGQDYWRAGMVSLGVIAGVVDGYYVNNGGLMPLVLPYAAIEGDIAGVSLMAIPAVGEYISPALAVSFKWRMQ